MPAGKQLSRDSGALCSLFAHTAPYLEGHSAGVLRRTWLACRMHGSLQVRSMFLKLLFTRCLDAAVHHLAPPHTPHTTSHAMVHQTSGKEEAAACLLARAAQGLPREAWPCRATAQAGGCGTIRRSALGPAGGARGVAGAQAHARGKGNPEAQHPTISSQTDLAHVLGVVVHLLC